MFLTEESCVWQQKKPKQLQAYLPKVIVETIEVQHVKASSSKVHIGQPNN